MLVRNKKNRLKTFIVKNGLEELLQLVNTEIRK